MKRINKIAATGVLVLLAAAILLALTLAYDYRENLYEGSFTVKEDYELTIQAGDNLRRILSKLQHRRLLEPNRSIVPLYRYAQIYAYLNKTSPRHIQTGEYLLQANMTFRQFLDNILAGQVIQRKFSIIEGHTMQNILEAMRDAPKINVSTTDYRDISRRLALSQTSPEGWIFPDTYYYTAGIDAMDLIERAYQKMHSVLTALWQARDPRIPLTSPYQALILASIVEKETAKIEERPRVAGVFTARLSKRMRLQADSTIIYGLGDRFDGDLRYRDLKEDQPYNSYVHKGLPPTPIAMPSLSSIDAVMNPEFGDYLYFVAKGDGSHYFSKTYAEHKRAVQKYQLKQ